MVSFSTIAACTVTLLISLVLPVAVLIGFASKQKKQGIVSAWLLGAAGFFVPQMLLRLPLMTALQTQRWFLSLSQNHLFLYSFSLALTAGLFEAAGRFAAAKAMEKRLTWNRSLAAGLGHGGIEAMLLVGMTYVNNLLYIFMINSGAFDILLQQTAALGADTAQLELIRTQMIGMPSGIFLLAGVERLLTMVVHLAMSVLVCFGAAHKKMGICLLLCIGMHTLTDLTAGISLVLPQKTAYPLIYTALAVIAVLSVWILRGLRKRWNASDAADTAQAPLQA